MQKQMIKQAQVQAQKSDLIQLVDESFVLDLEIKEKKKVLDANKGKLKALSIKEGKSSFSGELGKVDFSNSTSTTIDPKALYALMVEMGIAESFFDLVKVQIGDAKAKIVEMMLESITSQTVTKNNTLKFKKL